MHDYDYQIDEKVLDKTRQEPNSQELLKIIFTYISKISHEKDLEKLLVLMADMGRDLIVSDRCTVWLVDRKNRSIWTKVAHGIDRVVLPFGAGIVGCVAEQGIPLVINDPYSDNRFDKDVDRRTGYTTHNIIAIPINNSEGEVIGVFQGVNKMTSEAAFADRDQERLLLASIYTGKELEAAILHEEIVTTQKEIIFTMAEIGEMRSKETGNHVKRVAEYSRELAIGCGMSEAEAELIKMSSPMHDIGKIAIPDSILLKPGKLTEEEWKVMQTHTQLGYDILKHSARKILKAASIVAHQHHEKWNGTGYPEGSSGENIHIYGRITAIADVFDALASDRCYKKAWELEKVLSLFKDEKGKHFDPGLIDVFFDHLDAILKIRDTYRDAV
ncbi:MAG: HD domain-containing protein [Candidatus Wallbacteria bacterium]|nr:HD domain-containing protein [Candidatus Wallbacteria bacterium]